MAPPLTIRNLTPTPLNLVVLERYVTPKATGMAAVSRFATNVTSTIGISAAPTPTAIAENAESFAREECNIRIEAFSIQSTEKSLSESEEVSRLTFEVEGGQRYRADVPSSTPHSNKLIPLTLDPTYDLTVVYISEDAFLTILSSADLEGWMSRLPDHLPLSALSIPGTHNSPTCFTALPSVRCQVASPRAQLDNGVRFFDIRVQPESPDDASKDGLVLVHGVFPISLTGAKYLRPLLDTVKSFLTEHASETVIICLKREGPGEHTDQQLSRILRDHYLTDDKWFTEPCVPNLGQVRGKMVLMRRFGQDDEAQKMHDGAGIGINAEGWAYNTTNDARGHVVVQDFCEVLEATNINQKISACCEHLDRSGAGVCSVDAQQQPLYLNFLSASNFWRVGCWPEKIAAKLNPSVIKHLCVKHVVENGEADWCTGVVVCDWVGHNGDWDLIRCIVGMNSKIMVRTST